MNDFTIRPATPADVPALEELIPLSTRELMAGYYTPEQMAAALSGGERTSEGGTLPAHRTAPVFGGDRGREGEDAYIDPATEPARVRAFFVHPDWARRGIGRALLSECEAAIRAAGFRDIVMVATLAGVPLYEATGYTVQERYEVPLAEGLVLPVVRMGKTVEG